VRVFLLILISFSFSNLSTGQKEDKRDHTVGYHQIFYSGLQINNHGFGGSFRRGFRKTVKKKTLLELDFVTLKHPREVKQSSSELTGNFVFGKLNYAYDFRIGYGQHNVLAYKPFGEGVELKAIYSFGLTATILKPAYYLVVFSGDLQPVEERFDPEKHELYNIIGSGSYFKGFNELTLQPGLYGKLALNFEYASDRQSIRSLETGIVVDAYHKDLEILAFDRNYPVYISFYLSLQYGRKWYR
jgi:hypothetical protein